MINAYNLADAIPAALFGMFALWAAASRRHWFVRLAVVAAALLVTLLIPAFEVAFEFAIECFLVVVGIALWRRRRLPPETRESEKSTRRRRVHLSLESLMLIVVIVAVATAVAVRAPRLNPSEWYQMVVTGTTTAAACLASVWIVFGKPRWWVRALAAPVLVLVVAFAHHALLWASYIFNYWLNVPSPPISNYLQVALRDLPGGMAYWSMTAGLGMALLCAWLLLMRGAEWFDPFTDRSSVSTTKSARQYGRTIARCAALVFFGLVAIFPLLLLYRLLTPTPIPAVNSPQPNGYDDFVAAGRMVNSADAIQLRTLNKLSDPVLKMIVTRNSAALDRAAQGLDKICANPKPYAFATPQEEVDMLPLLSAMAARGALAERVGASEKQIAAWWELLQVTVLADHGGGANYSIPLQWEESAAIELWKVRDRIDPRQRAKFVTQLLALESNCEPWSVRTARQRIIDENVNWKMHLQAMLSDWSGMDRYQNERQFYLRPRVGLRLIVLDLAIRDYRADTGKLPAQLSDLVPKYLPAVPDDPFGAGPMKYRLNDAGYTIYSVGPDGKDDNGKRITLTGDGEEGDYSDAELFPAPKPGQASPNSVNSTPSGNPDDQPDEKK